MAAHIFEFAGGPKCVPFTVRLVTKGMGFGLWDRGGDGWALVHESECCRRAKTDPPQATVPTEN